MVKKYVKRKIGKRILRAGFVAIQPFLIPIILITILMILVCYITDIFYIGVNNEEETNFKEELKYYTAKEYTKEDTTTFFDSVADFLSGIFKKHIDSRWPVPGHTYISSHFGKRDAPTSGASTSHSGIDIPAPEGTEIISIMDGTVTKTSWGGAGGYTITIQSEDGVYEFSYCHVSPEFIVNPGQKVMQGEVIGTVGPKYVDGPKNNPYKDSTGKTTNGATTGCHCHFTLRENGKLVDPEEYLSDALELEQGRGEKI